MQICSATIRLAGSVQNTVYKTDITPAEILVLQSIHGGDAVIDIVPIETKQRSQHEEWDRLTGLYDRSGGPDTPDGREDVSIVSRLFPGAVKRLPVTLKEIGLEDREAPEQVAPDAEEAIEAPKPRRARKPAEVVAEAPTVAEVAEAEPAPKKGLDFTPPAGTETTAFVEGDDADKPATDPVGEQQLANAKEAAEAHAAALEGLTNDAISAD